MSDIEGFFVDWNGKIRRVSDPGGGYHCDAWTSPHAMSA